MDMYFIPKYNPSVKINKNYRFVVCYQCYYRPIKY